VRETNDLVRANGTLKKEKKIATLYYIRVTIFFFKRANYMFFMFFLQYLHIYPRISAPPFYPRIVYLYTFFLCVMCVYVSACEYECLWRGIVGLPVKIERVAIGTGIDACVCYLFFFKCMYI